MVDTMFNGWKKEGVTHVVCWNYQDIQHFDGQCSEHDAVVRAKYIRDTYHVEAVIAKLKLSVDAVYVRDW